MYWVRIDNRLIHGQIIETWLPFTGARMLVVANDELAHDDLRQEIMSMAIPEDIKLSFVSVADAAQFIGAHTASGEPPNALVLFATCPDAMAAYNAGLKFAEINIGNLHYGPGKKQVCDHVALSREDEGCLDNFKNLGVGLDFRCVPNDPVAVKSWR